MNKVYIFIFVVIGVVVYVNMQKDILNVCKGNEVLEKTIDGNSMLPGFQDGERIDFGLDYYDYCDRQVQTGDIVGYNYAGNEKLLMKRVYVTSEDSVSLSGSYLLVNGEILSNLVGDKYIFSEDEIKLLNLYITNEHIPIGSFFIFGDNTTSSIDSRKFGAISREDIVGKFILNTYKHQ